MQHYFILFYLSSFNALFHISFPRYPHSFFFITTGHVAREMSNLPILQKPPYLYLIASLHKPKSYKYLLSFSLPSFFYFSFIFLASCSQQRSHQERAPSLASFLTKLHHLQPPTLCENRLLLLDWGRVSSPLARLRAGHSLGFWPRSSPLTNLEPATPFGLGPCFFSGGKT